MKSIHSNLKIAVIGDDTMGHGIAEVFAKSGHKVQVIGLNDNSLKYALQRIECSLNEFAEKGLIEKDSIEEIIKCISFSDNLEDVKDADMVIEALPEDMSLKNEIFGKLEKICGENAILTTASGHSVSEVISEVKEL